MSDEYTPETDEVRIAWWMTPDNPADNEGESDLSFGRWLAEHDRQVVEKAWWEGAEDERLNGSPVNPYYAPVENGVE